MKTTKTLLIAVLLQFFFGIRPLGAQAYGEIRGIIKTSELEVVPFATVKILQGNVLISGSQTNLDGKYSCKPLNPGTYEMIVIHPEFMTARINKITVNPSEASYVDVKLKTNALGIVDVLADAIDFTNTGVDVDMFHTISMSAIELLQNSGYTRGDIKSILEFMSSEVVSHNGEIHIRGSRGDATGYFVDGVRTMEPGSIPGLAIENVSAFTGGIPAMYGDLLSGALIITTKTYFSGLRDKTIRQNERIEREREEKASQKAKEDEENRALEIEKEKKKENAK